MKPSNTRQMCQCAHSRCWITFMLHSAVWHDWQAHWFSSLRFGVWSCGPLVGVLLGLRGTFSPQRASERPCCVSNAERGTVWSPPASNCGSGGGDNRPLPQREQWQRREPYSLYVCAQPSNSGNFRARKRPFPQRNGGVLRSFLPVLGGSPVGKSKVIAGSHFGIFTEPAGHCGGQTHRVTLS